MRYQQHRHTLSWALALIAMAMAMSLAAAERELPLPDLRIMPLGDSITKGNGSPDTTGYREKLRQQLLTAQQGTNATVDMIGSLTDGDMRDANHEGHSGKFLADIRESIELSLPAKPNVVLIHAGTNNMDKGKDLDKADGIMESIIDRALDGSPGVTVLVAPVIWADNAPMQVNTDAFNKKLGAIIERKQGDGLRVLSVPIDITGADLSDMKHPNERGYRKMATGWYEAILDAHRRGWIQSPARVDANDLPGMGLGYR